MSGIQTVFIFPALSTSFLIANFHMAIFNQSTYTLIVRNIGYPVFKGLAIFTITHHSLRILQFSSRFRSPFSSLRSPFSQAHHNAFSLRTQLEISSPHPLSPSPAFSSPREICSFHSHFTGQARHVSLFKKYLKFLNELFVFCERVL